MTLFGPLGRLREPRRRCLAELALLERLTHRGRRHVLVRLLARPVLLQRKSLGRVIKGATRKMIGLRNCSDM